MQTSGYNTEAASGASVKVSAEGGQEVTLREGDGMYVTGQVGQELKLANVSEGQQVAEVLVFDVEHL